MRHRHAILLTALVAVTACDAGLSEPDGPFLGARAELYLNAALDIMEFNSIRKYEIDWEAFRATARAEAEEAVAVNPVDTYPAIEAALERIGDNHSFFRPAPGVATAAPGVGSQARSGVTPGQGTQAGPVLVDPSTELVAPGVGYVDVTPFSGGGEASDSVTALYHKLIEAVDTLGATCRWVVDVRGNTGGNMWPMLGGVGPVLGEDTVGYFVDPDSVTLTWTYFDGQAKVDDVVLARVSVPYELESPRPHVAVLTDGGTASSGEAVAVAFRGRPDTRSFGEPTWGVSTANSAFPLPDGAVIFLTVSTMVDRTGTVYGGSLDPDELIEGGQKTGDRETDVVLDAALSWLDSRSCG